MKRQPVIPHDDSGLNLREYFEDANHKSCYVFTRIYSSQRQSTGLLLGSDDTHRIWLNGRIIHENTKPRNAVRDQNAVLVTLDEGWNTVVARVDNASGDFAIYLRFSNDPFDLAKAFERNQEWDAALAQWDRACAADPENVSLRIRRAEAAKNGGQPDRALAEYAAAIAMVPDSAALIRRRAVLLQELGHSEEALAEYRRLVNLTPDDWDCLWLPDTLPDWVAQAELVERTHTGGRRLALKGIYHFRAGHYQESIVLIPQGFDARFPAEQARAQCVLAMAYYRNGQKEEATKTLQEVEQFIQQEMPTGGDLGTFWHDWLTARVLRREAVGLIRGPVERYRLEAAEFLAESRLDEAEVSLNQALALSPDDPQLHTDRANVLGHGKRWAEALDELKRLIKMQPKETLHWMRAASLLVETGDIQGYRDLCRDMQNQFSGDDRPGPCERTAKVCLLLPAAVDDMPLVFSLAESAADRGRDANVAPWYFAAQALANVRMQRYDEAVSIATKNTQRVTGAANLEELNQVVLALAYLGQRDIPQARKLVDQLRKTIDAVLARDDVGEFHDVLIPHILLREAEKLLAASEVPEGKSATPKDETP